jgi:hypothetical protein
VVLCLGQITKHPQRQRKTPNQKNYRAKTLPVPKNGEYKLGRDKLKIITKWFRITNFNKNLINFTFQGG